MRFQHMVAASFLALEMLGTAPVLAASPPAQQDIFENERDAYVSFKAYAATIDPKVEAACTKLFSVVREYNSCIDSASDSKMSVQLAWRKVTLADRQLCIKNKDEKIVGNEIAQRWSWYYLETCFNIKTYKFQEPRHKLW